MALDVPNLFGSPIFSPTTGFGGNGVVATPTPNPSMNQTGPESALPRHCVQDGPFRASAYQIRIGQKNMRVREDRCLERNLVDFVGQVWMTRQREQDLMDMPDYVGMSQLLEGGTTFEDMGVHGCSHATVG